MLLENYNFDAQENILVEDSFATLEGDQMIVEALMEDVGINQFSEEEIYALVECGLLSERSIVRLDKNAHKSRARKKAALIIAREKNDVLYKKLKKVYAQKKKLVNLIMKKYGTQANARVNKMKFTNKGVVPTKTATNKAMKKIAKSVSNTSTQLRSKDMK